MHPAEKIKLKATLFSAYRGIGWVVLWSFFWVWWAILNPSDSWLNYVGVVISGICGAIELRRTVVSFMDAHSIRKNGKLDTPEKEG